MARPATEARPFLLENPRSLSPVLLMCEHATNRLPFAKEVRAAHWAVLSSHWGWDIGGWELTRELAQRLSATAIGGRWSRLLIDLNRRVGDPTLIRRKAGRTVLPWNDGMGPEAVERRVLDYHTPYHVEVDRLILRRLVREVRPVLLAVHTFTPRFRGGSRPFQIGILYEHHRTMARRLGRTLRDAGLTVRYNQPYSGMKGMMYSVDRHGSHHRLPCLEVEVNQRVFEQSRAVRRLGTAIARGLRVLLAGTRG
jgi:predicted N-formylglutamate amidohydrolase